MTGQLKPFRRYLITLAIIILGGIAAVGGFNYWTDAYGIFGVNHLGIYASADRESKAQAYQKGDFNAVIMGNSKAAMIPAAALNKYDFFSATFGGAMPEELYYFADRYVDHGEVAIVLLDFWSFRDEFPIKEDPFAPPTLTETLDKLFSINTLDESIKTLRRNIQGEPPAFSPDGSFIAHRWIISKSTPNDILAQREFNEHARWFADFSISPDRMTYITRLAEYLRGRGIWTVAVLAPMHEHSLELMEGTPAAEQLEEWKARIEDIFPTTVDLIDSQYSAPENFFPADPTHFTPKAGVKMINDSVLPVKDAPLK
ncbi:hypothetical protein [Cerasicoccus arenae]|uniref:Uncharacterized protein n=1 Tax=Cerasicoccus arenae TaxID=424488 RepID=A0A8J3DAX3_9BACT|nr:hypothetical protein [Cerasicoccus arenae]MBK1858939.1 hypothetical protein [Cerasicoccus arenae]GHC03969.1 hypothetical protein GCM10007047_20740 [Cerasicoccus arenae]